MSGGGRRRIAALAGWAWVLAGCSLPAPDTGESARLARESLLEESEGGIGAPELPPDWVPDPVMGPPQAHPAIEVAAMRPASLSFRECVDYALPGWDVEVVFAHQLDKPVDLDERRRFRFTGGALAAFLGALEKTWDLAVTAPSAGQLEVSSRRVETWLITHWMRPPELAGGSGTGGSGQGGFGGNQQQQQQEFDNNRRRDDTGGIGSSQLTAEAFEGLAKLVTRLARIAEQSQIRSEGAQRTQVTGRNDGETRITDSEAESVWVNEEAGLLYAWASPNALRAMRPLLRRYGARRVAADPEVLAMMTHGYLRFRLSLVRVSISNDRNMSLRWEEGLQAVLPGGTTTTGLSGYGYGAGGTSRIDATGSAVVGGEGLTASLGLDEERDRAVYPFGTRNDLSGEQQRILAYQQAVTIDRERTEADLAVLEGRIGDLETALNGDRLSGGERALAERELANLRGKAGDLAVDVVELGEEISRAAARAANVGAWLERITEADERSWQRSLRTLLSLGSAHGETETMQTVSIYVRHGQLHPVQVGSELTYLGRVQQSISQSFSQQSAEPETRLEGLALSMLPWLESRRCVRVGLALQNSGVTSVATFPVGDTQLVIPQMAVQTWRAEQRLCDAKPMVVARFKLTSQTRTRGGIPLFGDREIPTSRSLDVESSEYLLLAQAVLPAEWGL